MEKKILSLGTIVYLKQGNIKLMIIGRGVSVEQNGETVFRDYAAVIYPKGIDPTDTIFFNHEDIEKVVFQGYINEEEERFLEMYEIWLQNKDKKVKEI